MTKADAVKAVKSAMAQCPKATNADLVVMAGNICGAFSHTYDPKNDALARRRLRRAIEYVKGQA